MKAVAQKKPAENHIRQRIVSHKPSRKPAFPSCFPTNDNNLIQRKPLCFCGGGCPRCTSVQAKLKIGSPHDRYEQEADRVAEQVMRMPGPAVQMKPT